MYSIFDSDKSRYKKELLIYKVLFIIIVITIILILLYVEKKRIYENSIYFSEKDRAYLCANKEILILLKEKKKIIIDDIEYDFVIEEIEKKDNNYLIEVSFPIRINTDTNKYQLNMENEYFLNFIIRIVKGA